MIRPAIVRAFVTHELRDLRTNGRVLPLLLVLPIISIGLPILLTIVAPALLNESSRDPGLAAMLQQAIALPEFQGLSMEETLTAYGLRATSGFFLLMPVVVASTWAAFSIVGEKQQRTLEPILGTPITDREFLLAKLTVCMLPTMVVTWGSALIAALGVDLVTLLRYGRLMLPDRFWLGSAGAMAFLLGTALTLVTMRLSARSVDPQATVQASALVIVPGFLLLFGVFGKLLLMSFTAVLIAIVAMVPVNAWLFRRVERTFRREEILTRWR